MRSAHRAAKAVFGERIADKAASVSAGPDFRLMKVIFGGSLLSIGKSVASRFSTDGDRFLRDVPRFEKHRFVQRVATTIDDGCA